MLLQEVRCEALINRGWEAVYSNPCWGKGISCQTGHEMCVTETELRPTCLGCHSLPVQTNGLQTAGLCNYAPEQYTLKSLSLNEAKTFSCLSSKY